MVLELTQISRKLLATWLLLRGRGAQDRQALSVFAELTQSLKEGVRVEARDWARGWRDTVQSVPPSASSTARTLMNPT